MPEKLCAELQVVVLMGGLGSRLQEKTRNIPKSMIEICGRPFFVYQLELMIAAGFQKFVFCLGHHGKMIQEYFGDGRKWGIKIQYSLDGEYLLGTGGAVRKALPILESEFLLIYGDSFMDVNYFEIVVRYRHETEKGKKALMTVMRNENRLDKSNVVCKDGEIELYDKCNPVPTMEHIDYGINIFQREIFKSLPENVAFDLSAVQHELSVNRKLACCEVEKRFYEIGTPEALREFTHYAQKRWHEQNKAVFLDRDGVLNELCWNDDIEQLDSPLKTEDFIILPGVKEALKRLRDQGYLLFVVTNQPAAAKGKTTYENLCSINHFFIREMQSSGIDIADVMMCPHFAKKTPWTKEEYLIQQCGCRKPKTGMLQSILEKYKIDKEQSWMVGDSATDILCGKAVGLRTVFIGKYKCDLCMMTGNQKPDLICKDLEAFAEINS